MNMIRQVMTAWIFICCLTIFSCNNKPNKKPNIIFIMSDDHAFQAISAYNDRFKDVAPTPNIDRIANMGMRFDRCLVTNSICGPSRATLLTGKYNHLNGFISNRGADFDGSQQTFPKLLQKAGYHTAIIGKWHLGSEPTGFDHWDILPGQGSYYNPDFITPQGTGRIEGYVSDIINEKTLEWLKNASVEDSPFLLMVHHKAPHRNWQPGPKYLDHFKGVVFPEPSTLFDDYSNRGRAAHEQDMSLEKTMLIDSDLKMWAGTNPMAYRRMTKEQQMNWDAVYLPIQEELHQLNPQGEDLVRWKYQRYMYDYLSCILSVDEGVGQIMDFLKENGLDKNTVIVYTSDQGFYLGEHGWFDKRFMFEESYRTPLLIAWPGVVKPGSINKDIVSNLDFAQTFLDLAGAEISPDMQGQSLLPLLKGNTPSDWRKAHYYQYMEYPGPHMVKRHYGVSDHRYKLMHFYYDIDEWELYDLVTDPQEMKNVYDDPAYLDVRTMMHRKLDSLRVKYKDSDEVTRSFLP
jgi:arylsulfatase A-like enzyme